MPLVMTGMFLISEEYSYRLVADIVDDVRTVYIRFIGTHAEYDKLKDCSMV